MSDKQREWFESQVAGWQSDDDDGLTYYLISINADGTAVVGATNGVDEFVARWDGGSQRDLVWENA